jgi:hypothetical protein
MWGDVDHEDGFFFEMLAEAGWSASIASEFADAAGGAAAGWAEPRLNTTWGNSPGYRSGKLGQQRCDGINKASGSHDRCLGALQRDNRVRPRLVVCHCL